MSDQFMNEIFKSPIVMGIAVVVCIIIVVTIFRSHSENFSNSNDDEVIKETFVDTFANSSDTFSLHSISEKDKEIIEYFPAPEMNVMYSDANGNLATTRDLGLANLTVSGDSKFGGNILVNGGGLKPAIKVNAPVEAGSLYSIQFGDGSQNTSQTGMGYIKDQPNKMFGSGASLATHIHQNDDWSLYSSGWDPLFGVKGGSGDVKVKGALNAGGAISTDANLLTKRGRLSFMHATDPNHTIYNNYTNIDGEGVWDGMKMNVYDGLDVRTGNANGAVPKNVLSVRDNGVSVTGALTANGSVMANGTAWNPAIKVNVPVDPGALYSIHFGDGSEIHGRQTGMGYIKDQPNKLFSSSGASLATHIHQNDDWSLYSSGWDPLFGIKGGSGDVKVKGALNAGAVNAGGAISTDANLLTKRGRLSFMHPTDPNHTIYNNYTNIDGEGGWDGMKMNTYAGLDIRTGNANGAVPKTVLSVRDNGVSVTGALTANGGGWKPVLNVNAPVDPSSLYSIHFGDGSDIHGRQTGMGYIKDQPNKMFSSSGASLATHIHQNDDWSLYSSGWDPLFSIKGGSGDMKVKGNLNAGSLTTANSLAAGSISMGGINMIDIMPIIINFCGQRADRTHHNGDGKNTTVTLSGISNAMTCWTDGNDPNWVHLWSQMVARCNSLGLPLSSVRHLHDFRGWARLTLSVPPGKVVKVWGWNDSAPYVIGAGLTEVLLDRDPHFIWAGREDRQGDFPDSLRLYSHVMNRRNPLFG